MAKNTSLVPSESALLIIDMLNYFSREGNKGYQRRFWSTAAQIKKLRDFYNSLGTVTIYINSCYENDDEFQKSALAKKEKPFAIKGSEEAQVIETLHPCEDDLVVEKTVNSGFYNTNLDILLTKFGIKNLILTGVHSHVCILLTAADGFYRNYDNYIPKECITTKMISNQRFAIRYINRHFGLVLSKRRLEKMMIS